MQIVQTSSIILDKTEICLPVMMKKVLFVIYGFSAFTLPFLLGHPQFLVGVLVNAVLVLGALHMKKYSLLPLIILPSFGVLARGLIFGPFTIFLIYMIPFIRFGNLVLVWGMKYFYLEKAWNKFLALGVSAFLKFGLLFGVAWILVSLDILPQLFLTTMGIIQLGTALTGGILALGVHTFFKK